MFETAAKTKLQSLPRLAMPKLVGIKLHGYQKDAIRWMFYKETTDEVPPYWKQTKFGK